MELPPNTSFSRELPSLQLAWDSTSMGAFKSCPRKYYYSIVLGWTTRGSNIHLFFGGVYHATLERYDHAIADGKSHDDALDFALDYALRETWDKELSRPWVSDDSYKNRFTLVRSIIWYLDQFSADTDPLQTLILANGKPAVELSFRFPTSYSASSGEPFWLCGHLDRMATLDSEPWIVDRKTTKGQLNDIYFANYTPDNQFSGYLLAGQIGYEVPARGIIVDAVQIAVSFSRFERRPIPRPPGFLEEWYEEWGTWVRLAEAYARAGTWPANDKSCGMFGGCEFRGVCSKSPSVRGEWLKAGFVKRVWDPMVARGDI